MKKLTILFLLFFCLTHANSQVWYPLGSGTDNRVNALTEYEGDLIAGGDQLIAGGVYVNKIGLWNGSTWSPMEHGIDSTGSNQQVIYALTNGNSPFDHLIAAGRFTSAGGDTSIQGIAQWSGTIWTPLAHGLGGGVYSVIYKDNILYAGGNCSVRYGITGGGILRWNGSSWDSLTRGVEANAMAVYNGQLIAGGQFDTVGGISMSNIAQWNGSSWSPLGSGIDPGSNISVTSLIIFDGKLIAGGSFSHAGGENANHIAKWDGFTWSPLGNGLTGIPQALTIFQGNLIAGTNESAGAHLFKWDGSSWSPMAGGTNGGVYSLLGSDFALYVGGQFDLAGGISAHNIAKLVEPGNVIKHKYGLDKPINSQESETDSIKLPYLFGGSDNNSLLYITGVKVTIDTITYPRDSDLELYLIHESVTDTLIYQAGGTGGNFRGTILTDSSSALISNGSAPFTGSFRPYKPLSQFIGQDPGGVWILKVYNRGTGNTGIFEAWSLDITYGTNPIGIKPISSEVPKSFNLSQNFPNPFNPSTKFDFAIPRSSFVKVTVYDILGREVVKLVNEELKAGNYQADWNAADCPSGVYFYRLIVGDNTNNGGIIETKKMVLVK